MPHNDEEKGEDQSAEKPPEAGDLSVMLQELRVLLQGAQLLTGFLIVLPFNQEFASLSSRQHGVYLATFACALASLIIFSAPAAQHRLEWPLRERAKFKEYSTRMIIIGLIPLSLALILGTNLVVTQEMGVTYGIFAAAIVTVAIAGLWWLFPYAERRGGHPLANI